MPKTPPSKGYKALSVFEPRQLPQVVILADGSSVLGPFCAHCGFPATAHTTDKVRGGAHRGQTITACPPPNGLNPMDHRCPACTRSAMGLTNQLTRDPLSFQHNHHDTIEGRIR